MGTAKAKSFGLFPHTYGRRDPADRLHTTTTSPPGQTSPGRAVAVHSLESDALTNPVTNRPRFPWSKTWCCRRTVGAGPGLFQPRRHPLAARGWHRNHCYGETSNAAGGFTSGNSQRSPKTHHPAHARSDSKKGRERPMGDRSWDSFA